MPDEEEIDLGNAYVGDDSSAESKPENVYEDDDIDLDTSRSETKPKALGKRESTEQLVTMLWGGAGLALIHSGADVPVGRVLQLQAPLAGKQIESMIAGTWIDKALQPLVASANKTEGFGALIALPLMVALYERNEIMAPLLEPLMKEVVSATLIEMAPVLRKKRTKERAAAKTIDEITQSLGLDRGDDPVLAVINSIFRPIDEVPQGVADNE